jgi:hypothetical protein
MINLNDSKFATATSKVFNNGKAGVAQNVTVSVSKRGADEDLTLKLLILMLKVVQWMMVFTCLKQMTKDTKEE